MFQRLRYWVTLAAAAVVSFAISGPAASAATTADWQASQVEASALSLLGPSGPDEIASVMDDSKPDWLTGDSYDI